VKCHAESEQRALPHADLLARTALPAPPCRCSWHLSQNISKELKKAMGAHALQELTRCFRAAVYATTDPEMCAKWDAVMHVLLMHDSCVQRRCKQAQLKLLFLHGRRHACIANA
jgi:hypothetical protein